MDKIYEKILMDNSLLFVEKINHTIIENQNIPNIQDIIDDIKEYCNIKNDKTIITDINKLLDTFKEADKILKPLLIILNKQYKCKIEKINIEESMYTYYINDKSKLEINYYKKYIIFEIIIEENQFLYSYEINDKDLDITVINNIIQMINNIN